MIIDDKLVLSDKQLITVTAASTNVLNFGEVNANLGEGTPLVIRFIVEVAFATGTSLQISLQHGATDTPATTLVSLPAILTAALTKGAYIPEIKIPDEHLQYMRLYYTVVGTYDTGSALTAFISLDR